MNVADMYVFSKVASTGSFSEAARQLGMTYPVVSKKISQLEKDLGVVLVRRTTHGLSLTDSGRIFYDQVAVIDEMTAQAVAAVSGADQRPSGNLSCSLPSSMGAALMPLLIRDFRPAWPEVTLNVHLDERIADLVRDSHDVAIRIADKLDDSSLTSRRLGVTSKVLVASPGYLARHGTPNHVSELSSHRCLGVGDAIRSRHSWRFGRPTDPIDVTVDCSITANSDLALIVAACMDDGILYVPKLSVGGELACGRLQEILPELCREQILGVYAVYPYRKAPAKVRVFIDFVAKRLPELETVDRWSPFDDQGGATP